MSLASLMSQRLPLNRKECYYTGTVFPQIVCAERGAHFDRLFGFLDVAPREVAWDPSSTNVQFFTEYSLRESIFTARDKERFPEPPGEKYTPDVMIFIEDRRPLLIALEAKMFGAPSGQQLVKQMHQQDQILNYLKGRLRLGDDSICHAALVPRGYREAIGDIDTKVVTWQDLHATFLKGRSEDYYLGLLRLALEEWEELHSVSWSPGATPDERMRGIDILTAYREGALPYRTVGRQGGLKGFAQDVETGGWQNHLYPLRLEPTLANHNWFALEDFVLGLTRVLGAA